MNSYQEGSENRKTQNAVQGIEPWITYQNSTAGTAGMQKGGTRMSAKMGFDFYECHQPVWQFEFHDSHQTLRRSLTAFR